MRYPDLSPSAINKWTGCDHYLTLEIKRRRSAGYTDRVHDGFFKDEDLRSAPENFTEMLYKKGLLHEQECLEKYYEVWGEEKVYVVPGPRETPRDTWSSWIERVGNPFDAGYEVIFQMPFKQGGMRGIADFLERKVYSEDDERGVGFERVCYEPVDSKLSRNSAKISHIKQLLFYSEALAENFPNLGRPEELHVALGAQKRMEDQDESATENERLAGLPVVESFEVDDYWWQWNRTRDNLANIVALSDSDLDKRTSPEWCSSCSQCEYLLTHCSKKWAPDALHVLGGIHKSHIEILTRIGIDTIGKLALLDSDMLPAFKSSWQLSDEVTATFNLIRDRVQTDAGVTQSEIENIPTSRPSKYIDTERMFLSDLDPHVLAKLWRQARLQTIRRFTVECPDCSSLMVEEAQTCSNVSCSWELSSQEDKDTLLEGQVMLHLLSFEELHEAQTVRSQDRERQNWQLEQALCHLPDMNEFDVYIDFEGHPFWNVDEDIIFLFGYLAKSNGEWIYESFWSHDANGYPSKIKEREKAGEFLLFLHERWLNHPEM
ncbi:MAG: hypothetical protein VX353_03500 [Actinomycetota bacterium]